MKNLEYKKYKRLFVFGCSFTHYYYPTWATIMSKNIPRAEYHNLGMSGAGNAFISSRIIEANKIYKFCDTDLLMVMWSTYCREDRYMPDGYWKTPGNIYSQGDYDHTTDLYFKQYGQPLTYLVRDLATIETTTAYVNQLPCDSVLMLSVPLDHQILSDSESRSSTSITDDNYPERDNFFYYRDLYSDLEKSYNKSLLELQMNGVFTNSCEYKVDWSKELHSDYHPSPENYFEYLQKIGLDLNDAAKEYASESTEKLKLIKHQNDFEKIFPNLHKPLRHNLNVMDK